MGLLSIDWSSVNNKPNFEALYAPAGHNHDSSYYTKPQVDAAIGGIDLSGRVPYTGATGPVNLGAQGLTAGSLSLTPTAGDSTIRFNNYLGGARAHLKSPNPNELAVRNSLDSAYATAQVGDLHVLNAGGKIVFEGQAAINLYRNATHLKTDAVFTASSINALNSVTANAVGSVFGAPSPFDGTMSLGVRPNATGRIPLGIRLLAGQTADALQVQSSTGAVLTSIGPTGNVTASTISATSWVRANGYLGVGGVSGNNSYIYASTPGVLSLYDTPQTAGIGLDFATDGVLKIRNRAQSAFAHLQANSLGLWGGTPPAVKPTLAANPTNAELATLLASYGLVTLV